MKTPSKLFILVLFLLAFLASLAWAGVRHIADILREFDDVTQVDLVLMETATDLNDLLLKKEIIFARLSSSSEELAFGQVNAARSEYLQDYIKGLKDQFDGIMTQSNGQMARVESLSGVPDDLKISFEALRDQTNAYDATVEHVFNAVEQGGFQLSLDDLDQTDTKQKILTDHVQTIVSQVWGMVHDSLHRSQHWRRQSKLIFWFSLLLTVTLGILLFAFKKNLEEISLQKKDLEKLNQELDRFVHTISHDIAGPLTTIVGYAAFLETHYAPKLDHRGQECILGVRKGASRLNVLIKDMLELTKMSRVKNPYSRVKIKEVINAALANCEFTIRESKAQIKIQEALPEIVGDRIKLTAAFFNLISNALKFSRGIDHPVLEIGWNETLKDYEFYVKDNGIGIDSAHHQEIFDIFKRLHSPEQYSGSGIGLTIVKAAIEDQGGQVRVESSAAQGAKFIFTIPKNLNPSKPLY